MLRLNTHVLAAGAVLIAAAAAVFAPRRAESPAPQPAPHTGTPTAVGAARPDPITAQTEVNPHTASGASADAVSIGKVARAEGSSGHTIAELFDQRARLLGTTVRVRGVVVKSIEGVLERSFVHLRDGSGDANAKTNDLVVTTVATPRVGDTLLIEGKLGADKDFGSGYRYPLIIEDARVVSE